MAILNDMLSNVVIAAVAKLVSEGKAKEAIADIPVGEHAVNELVHLEGVFSVGESYTQRLPYKARPWLLLGLLFKEIDKLTMKINSLAKEGDELYDSRAILSGIVENHVHNPSDSEETFIKKKIQEVLDALGETTETICNGKTKFTGFLNPVEPEDIENIINKIEAHKASKAG